MTDELTGLANRRSFFSQCKDEFKRAQRYRVPFSLLMLDIDEFKKINDTYGHDAGDQMLQCIAHTLRNKIREIDLLARLGGEEFGILLPNTKAEDASCLAERLRLAVEEQTCSAQESEMKVTVSIGITTFRDDMQNFEDVLKIADSAMYLAKNGGRNRIVFIAERK
jgi:diguanylate cyclase (GGDEF)-like protein